MLKIPEEIELQILMKLREDILNARYPANFNYDYNFYSTTYGFNCYSYAMQFITNYNELQDLHSEMMYPYNPGYISGTLPDDYSHTKTTLIDSFLSDCIKLNIYFNNSSLNEILEIDEAKIAILLSEFKSPSTGVRGYHFVRQNNDLSWSEMNGVNGNIRLISSPTNYSHYKLLEVVKIKKRENCNSLTNLK